MRLKLQMLVAGLATLAIPIAGWHSIRQLDDALEETRRAEQQLRVDNALESAGRNEALMSVLKRRNVDIRPDDLDAPRARFPIFIDGYFDDWRELNVPEKHVVSATDGYESETRLSVRTAVRDSRLFVFVDVKDDTIVHHRPPSPVADYAEGEAPDSAERLVNGDALDVMVQQSDGRVIHALFRATAPGPLVAITASASPTQRAGVRLGAWRAYWRSSPNGLQLEASIPLPDDNAVIAMAYVDVDVRSDPRKHWAGSLDPSVMALRHRSQRIADTDPRLHRASNEALTALNPWVTPSTRARLFDARGRLVADASRLYEEDPQQATFDPAKSNLWEALVFRVVSVLLRQSESRSKAEPLYERIDGLHLAPDTLGDAGPLQRTRRYQTDEVDFVLGTRGTVRDKDTGLAIAYLLFESIDNRASSYAGSQLARLMSLLILVSAAVGGSLLVFASVLSFRIRRLSRQASKAVSEDGRIAPFRASSSSDEIRDLSRNLGSLRERSRQYTHYPQALSSRLSHELRTPLSVVRTSLENIDETRIDEQTRRLLNRAVGGSDQLGRIIKALVDSTRLEQTVRHAQREMIPINAFMEGSLMRYRQVYPTAQFQWLRRDAVADDLTIFASPDLLQQALDKLADNAVSFATYQRVGLQVSVQTQQKIRWVVLSVSNDGELSAELDPAQAFDPMVSSRNETSETIHLGVGLYIVRAVAEAHGGRAFMHQRAGVVTVSMALPLSTGVLPAIASH